MGAELPDQAAHRQTSHQPQETASGGDPIHRMDSSQATPETDRPDADAGRQDQGHWNYYGLIGNWESLTRYAYQTQRILFKWLNRRSQRKSYSWEAFNRLLQRFQVPPPRIMETVPEGTVLPSRPRRESRTGAPS